jgi:hypothetical protein
MCHRSRYPRLGSDWVERSQLVEQLAGSCPTDIHLDLSFPTEFGIASPVGTSQGNRDEWIVGFVNAAPYISAALLSVIMIAVLPS